MTLTRAIYSSEEQKQTQDIKSTVKPTFVRMQFFKESLKSQHIIYLILQLLDDRKQSMKAKLEKSFCYQKVTNLENAFERMQAFYINLKYFV